MKRTILYLAVIFALFATGAEAKSINTCIIEKFNALKQAKQNTNKRLLNRFKGRKNNTFASFKSAKLKKVVVNKRTRSAWMTAVSSEGSLTARVFFAKNSCRILKVCVAGKSCVHQLPI